MRMWRVVGGRRRWAIVVGVVGFAAAGTLTASVSPSRAKTADPLFSGVLQDASGSPLGGRGVALYAWPSEAEMARQAEGSTVRLTPIGHATATVDGSFALAAGTAASGLAAGIHDVTITADAAPGRAISAVDTSVLQTGGRVRTIAGLSAGGHGASVDAGATTFVTMKVPAASGVAPAAATYCQYGITTTLVKKYYNRLTSVGGLYSATIGHSSRFVLSQGSDAQLGTAVNFGSWKAGGAVSRTLQATTRWGALTTAGYRVLQTRYTVGKYKVVVGDGVGSCVTYYTMKPISQEGGATSASTKEPTATRCHRYEKGSGITLDSNNAATWSGGLDISGLVGFDVSARSGYSDSEKLDVHITAAAGRRICGSNKFPAQGPSLVVVKP